MRICAQSSGHGQYDMDPQAWKTTGLNSARSLYGSAVGMMDSHSNSSVGLLKPNLFGLLKKQK